jgi:branched-chain amino acid transport system permease protein
MTARIMSGFIPLAREFHLFKVLLLVAMLAAPVAFPDPYVLGIITLTFLWAAAALAWNISGGYAGQFSIGHAAFYGIGAYTSTILYLRFGVSPWLGLLVGAALCAAIAAVLAWVTMRLRGSFFIMATLAFWAVTHIAAINWRGITNGTSGLFIPLEPGWFNFVFNNKQVYAYIALSMMVIFYSISRAIESGRFGYELVAFRENDDAARAIGIRTLRARILAFCLSAALTAICGTFHAQYYLYLDPDGAVSLFFSLQVALLAIVGGMGTAYGSILGSLLITPLSLVLQGSLGGQVSGLNVFVYSTLVIIILLVLPRGIGPAVLDYWRRR